MPLPQLPPHQEAARVRFIESGMTPELALEAAKMLGETESEWETFEREQPTRAWAKKLLVTGGRAAHDIMTPGPGLHEMPKTDPLGLTSSPAMDAVAKQHPIATPIAKGANKLISGVDWDQYKKSHDEKEAAAKMLREYLQSQDALRAEESKKEQLWMIARMPGQPLFGQPIYTGYRPDAPPVPPTPAPEPLHPLAGATVTLAPKTRYRPVAQGPGGQTLEPYTGYAPTRVQLGPDFKGK